MRLICWNLDKKDATWTVLADLARRPGAHAPLAQEAPPPPAGLVTDVEPPPDVPSSWYLPGPAVGGREYPAAADAAAAVPARPGRTRDHPPRAVRGRGPTPPRQAGDHGADGRSARGMAPGSHLAGRAIDISKTTAAHALSYGITKRCGVSHGHAVALTLGTFLSDHADAPPETLQPRVDPAAHAAAMADILTALADSVNVERLGNNWGVYDGDGLIRLLRRVR